jgi:hypothetical protein
MLAARAERSGDVLADQAIALKGETGMPNDVRAIGGTSLERARPKEPLRDTLRYSWAERR